MSDPSDMNTDVNDETDDAAVARLMQLAGPRATIPPALQQRVRANVQQEWQRTNRRQQTVRWALPVALAASLVVAFGLNRSTAPQQAMAPVVATVARSLPAGRSDFFHSGDSVRAGETVQTGQGQSLSLDLRDGASLRLAANSVLRIRARDDFELLLGSLYADTGPPAYQSRTLTVHTALAVVTDVGTQFLVNYGADNLEVAVREGRVDVVADKRTHTANAGQQLRLQPGGVAKVADVEPHAGIWDWAASVAPLFEIENRSLMDFLKWAARETGRELAFADNEQRMAAMRVVLHGSIDDFTPDEAVASVLATSGIAFELTPERIFIGVRPAD